MKNRIWPQFNDAKRDRELSTLVRRRLAQKCHGRFKRVKCVVDHGTVILTGSVNTMAERTLVGDIVRSLSQVDAVINELETVSLTIPARLHEFA